MSKATANRKGRSRSPATHRTFKPRNRWDHDPAERDTISVLIRVARAWPTMSPAARRRLMASVDWHWDRMRDIYPKDRVSAHLVWFISNLIPYDGDEAAIEEALQAAGELLKDLCKQRRAEQQQEQPATGALRLTGSFDEIVEARKAALGIPGILEFVASAPR